MTAARDAVVRRLSVLHVSQPTEGGVARTVVDLVAAQLDAGWRVGVAAPQRGPLLAAVESRGAQTMGWSAGRVPDARVLSEVLALRRLVRRFRPDVVHLHSSKSGLAGRLALRGRLPTIFQPHAWSFHAQPGVVGKLAVRWERAAARWTDVFICVSEDERRQGAELGITAELRLLPNAVDLARLRPGDRGAARRELGLADAPTVVTVGRLCRQKGQDLLLQAWPAVLAQLPQARLVLVGDGPDAAALRAQAPGGVRFAGPRSDVACWLAAADVVALPSRWEGMSFVLLETMAAARCVVATDVEGMREALGPATTAVVPPEDPAALARALVTRLRDPRSAAEEGSRARRRAERHHDLRAWSVAMLELTRRVAEGRGAAVS